MSDKYLPLTEEQFNELDEILTKEINAWIPENRMSYIWNMYLVVTNTHEPQPCSCQSAGPLWVKAVNTLNEWVKARK
jgi:hypothetical protein